MENNTAHGHGAMPLITDTYSHQDFDRDIQECHICGEWVKRNDTSTKCDPKKVRQFKKYQSIKARQKIVTDRMNARKEKYEAAQKKDEMTIWLLQKESNNIY